MKKLIFFCLISVLAYSQERTSEEIRFDLLHTELHIEPIWETETVKGKALLKLKPYFYPQNSIVLNAKEFDIKSVTWNNKNLPYTYDKRKLIVNLGQTLQATDTLNLSIEYIAQPNHISIIEGEENKSEKGVYFINAQEKVKGLPRQVWTQGETQSSSSWFPTLDSPNQNHTQDLYITVDKNLSTLSNGLLVNTTVLGDKKIDHWKQSIPHSVYLTMFAVGDFVKVVDPNFKRFEVSYYLEPEYAPYALSIFGRTPEMITYFEELLGVKYPWQKYAQLPVRKFVSGAMENTTATTHAISVMKNNNQVIDANDDAVIAHELFHHWFGNLVTCESWSHLPLNEAFANYSEYLWANYKYGKEEGDFVAMTDLYSYLSEADEKQVPLIRFNYASSEDMFDAHSYQKGGRILHLLRKEVGDKAFFLALNKYLTQHAHQNVETDQLRIVFEQVTGKDLRWFFNQWFFSEGHPILQVSHHIKNNKIQFTIEQKADSLQNKVFRVSLPMRIITASQVRDTVFNIQNAFSEFEVELEDDFVNYIPNAEGYFLGVVMDDRNLDQYIHQYNSSDEIYSRINALNAALALSDQEDPSDETAVRELYLKAIEDKFWRIRQQAVQFFNDYDGVGFLEVEKALEKRITTDESSNVRSEALLAVRDFMNPKHIDLARQALKDTSYSVRAVALDLLLSQAVDDADSLAKAYEQVKDGQIFAAIANYYVAKNEPNKLDWMLERIQLMESLELYQYIGLLGAYLVVMENDYIEKALPVIKNIVIHEDTWYTRLSGLRVLYMLKGISETAEEIFNEAKSKEKDLRLIKYYEQLDDQG